jgi:hypothetical protein
MEAQPGEQQPGAAGAQVVVQSEEEPETVLIFGRAEHQIGISSAASEGSVGGVDLTVRPILRTAELLEVVPGLIAAAHSGSGKANQYFLRGMNLDHGTDFTAFIDDVPWNGAEAFTPTTRAASPSALRPCQGSSREPARKSAAVCSSATSISPQPIGGSRTTAS